MKKIFITLLSFLMTVSLVQAIDLTANELKELMGNQEQSFGVYNGMVDGENYNVGIRIFNGSNYNRILASTTLSTDITWYLPIADGSNGQVLTTDGSGNLTFTTASTPSLTLGNIFVGNSSNEATATTTVFITNELVGIGTTSPSTKLDVDGTFRVSGATTFNYVAYTWPSSDGTTNFSLTTNGAGQLVWSDVSKASTSDTVVFNTTANEAITKGNAVYVSGELAGLPLVNKADADDSSKMPALGLAATTVASGSALQVIQTGRLTGFDTSSYTAGDALYVATTSGALVNYRPGASNELVQKIAQVENSDASGNIIIFGAGRSNDVPNTFTMTRATSTDFTVTGNLKAGTVVSGTWNGTAIGTQYGGTGQNFSSSDGLIFLTAGTASASSTIGADVIADQYLFNTGDTGTGVYDFGGATFEVPNGTDPQVGTQGQIAIDTTSGQFNYNDGTATRTLVYFDYFKGTLFASSTDAVGTGPAASSTFELPRLLEAFTITDIYCETDQGTSSLRIGDGTNWTELLLCDSDGAEDDGSIANGSFTAKETIQAQYLNNYTANPLQTALTIKYGYDED